MGRWRSMENLEGEGYFFLVPSVWDVRAGSNQHWANGIEADSWTPSLRSQFSTKPTNTSCEGNEDTGHFVVHSESTRRSSNVPTHRIPLVEEQQVPTFTSLTGLSKHEAIQEARNFTWTLCSEVSKYSASVCCDKGRCCPLMTMLLVWHRNFGVLDCLPSERFLYFKNHFHCLWLLPFFHVYWQEIFSL